MTDTGWVKASRADDGAIEVKLAEKVGLVVAIRYSSYPDTEVWTSLASFAALVAAAKAGEFDHLVADVVPA